MMNERHVLAIFVACKQHESSLNPSLPIPTIPVEPPPNCLRFPIHIIDIVSQGTHCCKTLNPIFSAHVFLTSTRTGREGNLDFYFFYFFFGALDCKSEGWWFETCSCLENSLWDVPLRHPYTSHVSLHLTPFLIHIPV